MIYWKTAKTDFENLQKTLEEMTNDRFRVLNVLPADYKTTNLSENDIKPYYVVVAFRMVSDKPRRDNRRRETDLDYNDSYQGGDETEGNV